jgi:hypothetical protein
MSPTNRRNPDHTNALGVFGWDVLPGFYRISASHPGCSGVPSGTASETAVYQVPPPVDGIVIHLNCPHLKRAKTHLRLKVKVGRGGLVIATATVRGHRPVGQVSFATSGIAATVPLARHGTAVYVLPAGATRVRVRYQGDANNAPSVARGRAR